MELGVSHEQNLSSLTPIVDNIFDKYNKNLVPIRSLSDHDIMIKNDLCYDLYDSDNGWGMGLGVKNQNDADVCALAEILKEDDDEDDASEKEEERKNIDNDNKTKATDEILKKIITEFLKY